MGFIVVSSALIQYIRSKKREELEPLPKDEQKNTLLNAPSINEEYSEKTLPETIEDAYTTLFNTLVHSQGLKISLTPRELLKALETKPFAEPLKTVTELHEKAVYGEERLEPSERETYFMLIKKLLDAVE